MPRKIFVMQFRPMTEEDLAGFQILFRKQHETDTIDKLQMAIAYHEKHLELQKIRLTVLKEMYEERIARLDGKSKQYPSGDD